jgi:hypothetical protein
MEPIQQVQEWLSKNLDGAYTISRMRSGEIMVSLQRGSESVAVIRKTFVEAATAILAVK